VDFAYSAEDRAFRDELCRWLDAELPPFLAEWAESEGADESGAGGVLRGFERRRAWQRRLAAGRWAAIHWPREWGGREATVTQGVLYSEVMAQYRTPGLWNANGIWQIGPMILRWGDDAQKRRFVPGILAADEHWCQGFSEPEAGSDLASLRTLALREGDEYVLTGRKIWVSGGHVARFGLFLVRTDPSALERGAKHEGISALIVDLSVPGVEARPIRDLAGEETFCEVFFHGARVPVAHRLGGEGEGWRVAMGTLGHERVGTAGLAIGMRSDLDAMLSLARSLNPAALDDPALRERVARAHVEIEYTRLLNHRALAKLLRGQPSWPEVPLAKLQWSHLAQTLAELAVDLLGPAGALWRGAPDAADDGAWSRLYVFQRYTSIGAGTSEVQKNILADRALGLPRR
jgi:alkylation response protein AidB-like acyl-CoA dehydrogenase